MSKDDTKLIAENEELKKELEDAKKQIEEFNNNWRRALADYQNLEKRISTDREELTKYATEKIIRDFLTVFDYLEKAGQHIQDPGLKMIIGNFWTILKNSGVNKIEVIGKKFDPHLMECVEVVKSDKEDEVVEEVRSGYLLEDKVLRVASVKVGKQNNS